MRFLSCVVAKKANNKQNQQTYLHSTLPPARPCLACPRFRSGFVQPRAGDPGTDGIGNNPENHGRRCEKEKGRKVRSITRAKEKRDGLAAGGLSNYRLPVPGYTVIKCCTTGGGTGQGQAEIEALGWLVAV